MKETNPKASYCIIPAIRPSRKGKTMETVKRSLVAGGYSGGGCKGEGSISREL